MKTAQSSPLVALFEGNIQAQVYLSVAALDVIQHLDRILASPMDDAGLSELEKTNKDLDTLGVDIGMLNAQQAIACNWLIELVGYKLSTTHPNTAAGLLSRLIKPTLQNSQNQEILYQAFQNVLDAPHTSVGILSSVADFVRFEMGHSTGKATRNDTLMKLLAKARDVALDSDSPSCNAFAEGFVELAGACSMNIDAVGNTLYSLLQHMKKLDLQGIKNTVLQYQLDRSFDPMMRLLTETGVKAPIFGPSLETMLNNIRELVSIRRELKADNKPRYHEISSTPDIRLSTILFDDAKFSALILKSMTLAPEALSLEMGLPTNDSYPFGWSSDPTFSSHPVVAGLTMLSTFLGELDGSVDQDIKEQAFTNMLGCLANWCGDKTIPSDPEHKILRPLSNRKCNARILDFVFSPERLQGALERCDAKGMTVMTEYVLDNHRALGGALPGISKGKYLYDDLGL